MVDPGARRSVVGKGVDFNCQGVGVEDASRRVFSTIADLGPIDRERAGSRVGNLLQNETDAIRTIVASPEIHVKLKQKWGAKMERASVPGRSSVVVDVRGELNAIGPIR